MSTQAHFIDLNAQLGSLIAARVAAAFGTADERDLMTSITTAGIDAANEFIELLNSGLTYENWKAFLTRTNAIDGVLGKFENENGDMAKLVQAFNDADLRETFDTYMADGTFTAATVEADIKTLKSRLAWAEDMWGKLDAVKGSETAVDSDTESK